MLRYLKRIVGLSPKLEWRCGSTWDRDVFKSMLNQSGTEISQYRSGELEWATDCGKELHEFKFGCLKHLLASRDGNSGLPPFPNSFQDALKAKEQWLADRADNSNVKAAAHAVAQDTGTWWPSNWCFGINAMFCAKSIVFASLEVEPSLSDAAQCAENLILYMGFTAACTDMACMDHAEPEPADNMGEAKGNGVVVRGVACPHMDDYEFETVANRAIDSTSEIWRKRLIEEWVDRITPEKASRAE